MSYTVLARKWRPKNFSELVGQSHVMQALANALDQNRLHHAYLFTGTRGVGKTTIARIFAKALNCQQGISSTPCGVCETCRSIDEGRFIDLIEVDAASKTKVDDTREILDNVQFAPTQGRYKVYLIDEVHMLSKSSFNALLKTLEEPPEHVKFLLATTDPHKLPITVLSRCLQFNLMRLTQTQIQNHLAYILNQEQVQYEDSALALIAKSADGSARDSLSLLDQAIAYGAGEVMFEPVQTMLGLVDQQFGVAILQALANDDAQQLKEIIQQLATMGVDYQALLSQLIEALHAISYAQVFADQETTTLLPVEVVKEFAQSIRPEKVQLLYQVALLAKQDMQLAPDIRIGFEMALMRMLAFQPAESRYVDATEASNKAEVTQQAQLGSPKETVVQGEMSPADALASLASARSLVGKKNAEIKPQSPIEEPIVEKSSANVTDASTTNEGVIPSAETMHLVTEQTAHSSQTPHTPEIQSFETTQVDSSVSVETVAQVENQVSTPSPQPEVEIDHLAKIRERLKQPLGKTEPQSQSHIESEKEEVAVQHVQTSVEPSSAVQNMIQRNSADVSSTEAQATVQPDPYVSSVTEPALNDVPPWNTDGVNTGSQQNTAVESQVEMVSPQQLQQEAIVPVGNSQQQPVTSLESDMTQMVESQVAADEFISSGDLLEDWKKMIEVMGLKGMPAEIARNSVLVGFDNTTLAISLDPEQEFAMPEMGLKQIEEAAQATFGNEVILKLEQAAQHFTPMKQDKMKQDDMQSSAQQSIESDPVVNEFISGLGMQLIPGSIKPI